MMNFFIFFLFKQSMEYLQKILIFAENNFNNFDNAEIKFLNELKNKCSLMSTTFFQKKNQDFLK